jgi:hypothetical protein
VGKGAVISILALADFVRVKVAKLGLVFGTVIQSLDSVVRSLATVVLRALVGLGVLA